MKGKESSSTDRHAQKPDERANDDINDDVLEEPRVPPKDRRSTPRDVQMPWLGMMSRLARQRSLRWRALAAGAMVLVVAVIFGTRSTPEQTPPQQMAPDTKLFYVTNRPTLVFEHFIGNVTITPGPDGQVSIHEMRSGEVNAIDTHYGQRGDTVTITVDIPDGLFIDTWVDFEVRMPKHAGFSATLATGTLVTTNLSGRIALSNTNGSIWATNMTGTLSAQTQGGSINLKNVSAEVVATTMNGTITTTATQLAGHSKILAKSGTINFHGTLSRTGSYVFQNSNGAVGLTLPSDSAFALTAKSNTGSINTDFSGVRVNHEEDGTAARGNVGTTPRPQLTIQTEGGSISVDQDR